MRHALVLVLLLTSLALSGLPAAGAGDADRYAVEITRTTYGVPHIVADDYGSMGYGYGYALATDNLCTMADIYTTVAAERSRHFGPDGSWSFRGNGTSNANLDSDFFYAGINASGRVEELRDLEGPLALPEELKEGVAGYVAGYNRFLADYRADAADGTVDDFVPHDCAEEDWVRPITELDTYRRFYQLASLASTGVAIDEIGSAAPILGPDGVNPPVAAAVTTTPAAAATAAPADVAAGGLPTDAELLETIRTELPARLSHAIGIGSNAYGIGSELSASGGGIVLGNPHFPWHGGERLYQSHLTVIGDGTPEDPEMNVAGASLYGVPLILIGHTETVAWSHTVSTAYRFTPFELTLAPGDPYSYVVDGEVRPMEATELTVALPDGEEATRTLYSTEYGPMMTGILGLPIFPWTPARAFAMGDANDHFRYLNHFWAKNHAESVRDIHDIQRELVGIPWVNTIAADAAGEAYYGDISSVPNVPDVHALTCATPLGQGVIAALGLPIMDGSRGDCDWLVDADAPEAGIFGPGNLPHLFRTDYVSNSNDSYWLTNPRQPLEGFAGIIGDERSARTLRTRIGLLMLEEWLPGGDFGDVEGEQPVDDRGEAGFDVEDVKHIVLNNRQHAAELVRDDLVARCRQLDAATGTAPTSSGQPTALTQGGVNACDVLAGWNMRDDLADEGAGDPAGAILFRRIWTRAASATGSPWLTPYDNADPVATPRTLNTAHPQVLTALGDAIRDLVGAGIPLDASLDGWQYEKKVLGDGTEVQVPVHGGPGSLGVFNAINVAWDGSPGADGTVGYDNVDHGSSFIMAVEFDPATPGCPDGWSFVTYSQSENPHSPHYIDQMQAFAEKDWNDMVFCAEEVQRDTISTVVLTGS